MTFTIAPPEIGQRYYVLPPVPSNLRQPLAGYITRYAALFNACPEEETGDAWTEVAADIANHPPSDPAELALKLLYVAHYDQPSLVDGALAIDLDAFDVGTGRTLVRCAAEALMLAPGARWQAALAEYKTLRAYSDGLPTGHADEDAAVDRYCAAMDALIAVPAPSRSAGVFKLQLIRQRSHDFNVTDDYWDALLTDLLGEGMAA